MRIHERIRKYDGNFNVEVGGVYEFPDWYQGDNIVITDRNEDFLFGTFVDIIDGQNNRGGYTVIELTGDDLFIRTEDIGCCREVMNKDEYVKTTVSN